MIDLKAYTDSRLLDATRVLAPEQMRPDRERVVSGTHSEITFTADEELLRDLRKIRDLWAHLDPNLSYNELLKKMATLVLAKIDPLAKQSRAKQSEAKKSKAEQTNARQSDADPAHTKRSQPKQSVGAPKVKEPSVARPEAQCEVKPVSQQAEALAPSVQAPSAHAVPAPLSPASRTIPAAVHKFVWKRDQGRCQYMDPKTQRVCHSTFMLELDHSVIPFAHGGPSTAENLRLSCRAHNALQAVQVYGAAKMAAFTSRAN